MLGKLRNETCLPKETLLHAGNICNEVFILQRGVLQVQPGEQKGGKKGKMLFRAIEKTGALVGIRDPFEKDYRYPFNVVAIKQATICALSTKEVMEVSQRCSARTERFFIALFCLDVSAPPGCAF